MIIESTLTKEEQIKILEKVLDKLYTNNKKYGLCYIIRFILRYEFYIRDYVIKIPKYIPLFTRENAIEHANARSNRLFWWTVGYSYDDHGEYDLDNRIKFIEWMISELKKE